MQLTQNGDLPLAPHPYEVLIGALLLFLLVAVPVTIALIIARRPRAPRDSSEGKLGALRALGVLVGIGACVAWLDWMPVPALAGLGRDAVVLPSLFSLCVLAFVVLGELVVRPRLTGTVRTAELRVRTVGEYLPVALTRALLVLAVGAAVLLVSTTVLASTDDMGRAGRQLVGVCSPEHSAGRGPFPGSYYVLPYLIGLVPVVLIGIATMRHIVGRSLMGAPDTVERHRRAGVQGVVGALGIALSAPLAGMAFFAASALLEHTCAQPGWQTLGLLAVVLVIGCLITMAWSLLALFLPVPTSARTLEPTHD